jgi:putative selenium metabolism protein SsnA
MLIVHGTLATQGEKNRLVADGALRIEGAHITEIGSSIALLAQYPDEPRLDAQGMLVMPGLISAHTHPYRILARGLSFLGSGPTRADDILAKLWWKLETALGYEDIRYSTLLYCSEAIRQGTTTLLAMHASPGHIEYALDAVAEATLQAGLRAGLSYGVSDRAGATMARLEVQENARFARNIRAQPLLAASMGLDTLTTLADETLAVAVGSAALSDIGFHVHLPETVTEARASVTQYGLRVLERLRKQGVLGPRTLVVGAAQVSPEEMSLLARAGSYVAYTPRADMQQGLGLTPVPDLLRRDVGVCLGDDGLGSNLWREMQSAYLLHRHATGDPQALPAEQVVDIAMRHNATWASRIFRERLGELAVGALADIILLDYPSATPLTEASLPWHLVTGLDGVHVDTTMVAGRVLMRHRALLTVDEPVVAVHARELAHEVWARL